MCRDREWLHYTSTASWGLSLKKDAFYILSYNRRLLSAKACEHFPLFCALYLIWFLYFFSFRHLCFLSLCLNILFLSLSSSLSIAGLFFPSLTFSGCCYSSLWNAGKAHVLMKRLHFGWWLLSTYTSEDEAHVVLLRPFTADVVKKPLTSLKSIL